jgi:PAS domain S-box-containing protein
MEDKQIRILLVEDNPGDVRLIREMLKESGANRLKITEIERLDQGLKLLSEETFEIVLLDLNLPDSQGLDTFVKVHAQAPDVPVVVLSGLADEALAIESVQKGAQDYLVKGQVEANPLMRSIRYAIERKQAEKAVRESEKRFRDITENAEEWIWEVDANGKYTYTSPVVEKILGYKPEEVLEKHFYDFFHPEDWEEVKKTAFETLAKKLPFAQLLNRNVHKNGREVWLSTSGVPILNEKGDLLGYRGADTDITERKKAEIALRESEQRDRTLVESITDGVIMIDEDFKVLVANPAALSIINPAGSDAYPNIKVLQEILDLDFRQLKGRLGNGEEDFGTKETVIRDHTYKALVSLIKGKEKGFAGWVVSLRDITEERKLDNLKSEFISVVSHELRTPLTCIKSAVDLLLTQKPGEINETQSNFLSIASRNVDRLARTINDFLDISKMEAGKMNLRLEKVNLEQIIEAAISTFTLNAEKKSIRLRKAVSSDLPQMLGDPDKLTQVVTNLLSNAIKYTPGGGEICIEATLINKSKSPIPVILSLPHEDFIKVNVADTGPGIPPDELERVFDKFHQVEKSLTRTEPGTGLGLPICKKLVEAHEGRIWVESMPNQGSRFMFVLPLLEKMEIFDHRLANLLTRAKSASAFLSLVTIKIKDIQAIKVGLGSKMARAMFESVVKLAKKTALKSTDYIHPDEESGRIYIILGDTPKEGAFAVCKRLKENFMNSDFSVNSKSTKLEFSLGMATYPDDAHDAKELRQIAEYTDYISGFTVRQKTILVIDDDENFAHTVARKLIRRGYKVLEAFNGADGIEKAKNTEPDLIILDMLMPKMDGYEVTSKLQQEENTKNIPILVLSGTRQVNVERILALGANEFLTKPFSDSVFLAVVERLIKRKEVNHAYNTCSR